MHKIFKLQVMIFGYFFFAGVVLRALSVPAISESSLMTRNLCVELVDVGDGLERPVTVDIQFVENGTAISSELLCSSHLLARILKYRTQEICSLREE